MPPEPTREELLTLALGVLPDLPDTIDVLSEDGGCFPLALDDRQDGLLLGQAPRSAIRDDLHLLARVYYPDRGRYEVELEVVEHFFQSVSDALVHLAVSGVRHRKARRASPRVAVSTPARAIVRYCRSLPRDAALEVRLVDISATGCAFVTQKELDPGDLVHLTFTLDGREMRPEARLVRLDPAPYGRYRAGCEITEISDGDRRAISALASVSAMDGSEEQRKPEVVAALAESRAATSGLAIRLGGDDNA
ncbi:MAG TPA: PilZ domain-containing protein [Gaiellales bacterium]|nr:PilZ domain-containing protein [Gaiellales bacterium]